MVQVIKRNYLPSKPSLIKNSALSLNSMSQSSGENQVITLYDFSSPLKPKKHQLVDNFKYVTQQDQHYHGDINICSNKVTLPSMFAF